MGRQRLDLILFAAAALALGAVGGAVLASGPAGLAGVPLAIRSHDHPHGPRYHGLAPSRNLEPSSRMRRFCSLKDLTADLPRGCTRFRKVFSG